MDTVLSPRELEAQRRHERFMRAINRSAAEREAMMRNPMRYGGDKERDAARFAHERAMLDRRANADIKVAEHKAFGMQHQGEGAAIANNGAAIAAAETEWAGRANVANTGLEGEKYKSDKLLEIERAKQEGALNIARQTGSDSLAVENTRQQGAGNVAQIQGQAHVDAAKAEAEARLQREQQRTRLQQARDALKSADKQRAWVAQWLKDPRNYGKNEADAVAALKETEAQLSAQLGI